MHGETLKFENRTNTFLYRTVTNKRTIISQTVTLLHVSTPSCHRQGACNQYLTKLHKYFKCSCRYVPGQYDRNINVQPVYTATTQTDFMRIVAPK